MPRTAAAFIRDNCRTAWIDWKCRVVVDVVAQVRDAARAIRPGIHMVLNTLPFGTGDYDNAAAEVFGQRFEDLAGVIDVYEVMAYHQILKRPVEWPAAIGAEDQGAHRAHHRLHAAGSAALSRRHARA